MEGHRKTARHVRSKQAGVDGMKAEYKAVQAENSVCTRTMDWKKRCYKTAMLRALLADDAIITNSYIGPYSSIGKAVKINDCEIDNCIILESAFLDGIDRRISGVLSEKTS